MTHLRKIARIIQSYIPPYHTLREVNSGFNTLATHNSNLRINCINDPKHELVLFFNTLQNKEFFLRACIASQLLNYPHVQFEEDIKKVAKFITSHLLTKGLTSKAIGIIDKIRYRLLQIQIDMLTPTEFINEWDRGKSIFYIDFITQPIDRELLEKAKQCHLPVIIASIPDLDLALDFSLLASVDEDIYLYSRGVK